MITRAISHIFGLFFIVAGITHFAVPWFFIPLIPDYLPAPALLNALVGVWELGAGVAILLPTYSRAAAWSLVVLLVLLIPAHIYFISKGSCIAGSLCVPTWVSWGRLYAIQPLLLWWAYQYTRARTASAPAESRD